MLLHVFDMFLVPEIWDCRVFLCYLWLQGRFFDRSTRTGRRVRPMPQQVWQKHISSKQPAIFRAENGLRNLEQT